MVRIPTKALRYSLRGLQAIIRAPDYSIRHHELTAAMVKRRFRPGPLFVGWFLHGGEDDGGARVHALMPHAQMRKWGIDSVILRKPRVAHAPFSILQEDADRVCGAGFDAVVFQGVHGTEAERFAAELRRAGTRIVYVGGDLIAGSVEGMAAVADCVVGASTGLAAGLAGAHPEKATVIESVIDAPEALVKDYARRPEGHIRVVWVGYPENVGLLRPVESALDHPSLSMFQLVVITRGPRATVQWDRRSVHDHILSSDIAVLPVIGDANGGRDEELWYAAKPNTRLTMMKSLGLPVIASPIASYLETLRPGEGCVYARTVEEWRDALLGLVDPDERRRMGLAGRELVQERYGVEHITRRWVGLFEELRRGE